MEKHHRVIGAPLDQKTLEALEESMDTGSLQEIIHVFITDTRRRLANLQEACREGDWARLQHEAHNLKSATATFGLQQAMQTARQLDEACQQAAGFTQIQQLVSCLQIKLPDALEALAMRYPQKS